MRGLPRGIEILDGAILCGNGGKVKTFTVSANESWTVYRIIHDMNIRGLKLTSSDVDKRLADVQPDTDKRNALFGWVLYLKTGNDKYPYPQ